MILLILLVASQVLRTLMIVKAFKKKISETSEVPVTPEAADISWFPEVM